MKTEINISGMHCTSCEKMIGMALEDVSGVELLSIDNKTGKAVLEVSDEKALAAAKKAIIAEGYKA